MRSYSDRTSSLAGHFREALKAAGVGASSLLLGCGGVADGAAPNDTPDTASGTLRGDPDFVPLTCDGDKPLYLAGIQPAEPVDYVDLRHYDRVIEQQGSACGAALDVQGCMRRLEAMPYQAGITLGHVVQVVSQYNLRATRADEVLGIATLRALREFLGEVDALGDAELLVVSQDYSLFCGKSGGASRGDGFEVLAFTQEGCDGRTRHLLQVNAAGQLSPLESVVERKPNPNCIVGRRPEGYACRTADSASLGGFFARSAELEAASVPAFVRLARELAAHGAPRALVSRAVGAAADEVRHARAAASLARAFGGRPYFARVPVGAVRSLASMAEENAVEGCVREAYGALVAHHQAARSPLAAVARTYGGIARDETRHAELAWDVAHWAEGRMPAPARREVAAARRRAVSGLMREIARARPRARDTLAGLPAPAAGLALAERLAATLWHNSDAA